MDDAAREQVLDARIQRRLATDPAYRYAENAEEQAQREAEIEAEEAYRLDCQIDALGPTVFDCHGCGRSHGEPGCD